MPKDTCWICGKPSVTYIDFTCGPLGDFREICSEDPKQGCYKVTNILLMEIQRQRDTQYCLRGIKYKLNRINILKQEIKDDLEKALNY